MKNKEEKLILWPYNTVNGIIICCKSCGAEMEETVGGRYQPIQYESEKYNRQCDSCSEN